MNKPEGYHSVIPYLIIKDASAFLDFMQKLFNAQETMKIMTDETHIMHAEIKIDDTVIMFADSSEKWEPMTTGFFVYVEDSDKSYQLALELGAKVVTPLSDQQYGRSGGVEDPFGNTWWITSVK